MSRSGARTLTAAQVGQLVGSALADTTSPAYAELVRQAGTLTDGQIADAVTGQTLAAGAVGAMGSQADYVGALAASSRYSSMTITRTDGANSLLLTCAAPNGDTVTHQLTPEGRYRIFGAVTLYTKPTIKAEWYWPADYVTTGAYTTPTGTVVAHTTEVGATWRATITTTVPNQTVSLRPYADNRGGVWRVTGTGGPSALAPVDVSLWAAAAQYLAVQLWTVETPGTYTITGTFQGADPANAPTGGVARGWTRATGDALVTVDGAPSPTRTLAPSSNKDFALQLRPGDGSGSYQFIPYHGFETERIVEPPRYYDGATALDLAALPLNQPVSIGSFEVVQHMVGVNASTGTDLIEVWTRQVLTANGLLSVRGRWKTLAPTQVALGSYHGMLMVDPSQFSELVSSRGRSYAVFPSSPGQTIVPLGDADTADGYAFLSAATPNLAAAVRYDNRGETLRAGQGTRPEPASRAFLELRAGGVLAKVYPRLYADGTVVPAGRVHRFGASYWYGSAPRARDVLTLT